MIVAKLIELGEPIEEFALEDGATVGDLLDKADRDVDGCVITVNNVTSAESRRLYNNDKVYITRATKGNTPFEVQLVRLGSSDGIINLPAEDGYTIKRVIEQLPSDKRSQFFNADGSDAYEYRIGGSGNPVNANHVLQRPASGTVRLILSQRMNGN